MKKSPIPLNIEINDYATIQNLAASDRRKVSDIMRNLLEDVADGKVSLQLPEAVKIERHQTAVRVDDRLRAKIDDLKARTGLSVDRIMHLAIRAITQSQTQGEQG